MFWTGLALFMTAVMGGFIAYNGDLMGRKFGKRRVTLFNLRPKHTAILITSVTGTLISALTTGVLFLLVPPVRNIILEGEEALRQNPKLRVEIKDLQTKRTNLEAEIVVKGDKQKQTESNLTKTQSQYQEAHAALESEQKRLASTESERKRLVGENTGLLAKNRNLREDNERIAETNKALAKDNFRLANVKRDLEQKNLSLAAGIADKEKQNAELAKNNEVLSTQNEDLTRKNVLLGTKNLALLSQNDNLLKTNRKLLDDNYRLDDDNHELTARNASLKEEVKTIETQTKVNLADLYQKFNAMKSRQVAVKVGEDLSRRVVPANATPEEARKVMQELVHDANEAALLKGAASQGRDSTRAVKVVNKQILASTEGGVTYALQVSEEDRTNAMVNRLAGSSVPICVLAVAVENSVEGEPASIDFQPFNDRMIYTKGHVVASPRRMNATESASQIYTELVSFLKDLGQSAIERGMIPRIDPATGNPQVGSLEWPELVELADRIRSFNHFVKVTAVAAGDTNASDPLKLTFRIDPSL